MGRQTDTPVQLAGQHGAAPVHFAVPAAPHATTPQVSKSESKTSQYYNNNNNNNDRLTAFDPGQPG